MKWCALYFQPHPVARSKKFLVGLLSINLSSLLGTKLHFSKKDERASASLAIVACTSRQVLKEVDEEYFEQD